MMNYIFKGDFSDNTIARFSSSKIFRQNLRDSSIVEINNENILNKLFRAVQQINREVLEKFNKFNIICLKNIEITNEKLYKIINLNKNIFINCGPNCSTVFNVDDENLLKIFKTIYCNDNRYYLVNDAFNLILNHKSNIDGGNSDLYEAYIFSKNRNNMHEFTHTLSDSRSIFTFDLNYRNIINLCNILKNGERNGYRLDIRSILVDNPMVKNIDNNTGKVYYECLNDDQFYNMVDYLNSIRYNYIICECAKRRLGSSDFDIIGEIIDKNIIHFIKI